MSAGRQRNFGLRTHVDALLDIAGDVSGLQVIDLGCGEGYFARGLAAKGAQVIGVDPLVAPVPEQRLATGSFRILQAGAEAVPLPAGMADIVTFIFSLHHVPPTALAAALGEAKRLLRSSGRLYVAEPLAKGPLYHLTQPFHDEMQVRTNAQAALGEFVEPEFEAAEIFHYAERRVFADFEAFARRTNANTRFNGYDARDVEAPEVIRRFDELFAQDGGNFDQPVLVKLYSRPRQ
ncbi:class I SAM-dependent methyltransferase [Bradyrhizobium sp.]|uniref:class I SAM-dependent methyltransferase n=1 Tax=Bradyrhizobium sp. TaxID=376 RepID=UPI0025BE8804|nr:class I SAM-dependent methyltransferase [Bradyrhizobium sp.]